MEFLFLDFAALYIFWGLGIWFFFSWQEDEMYTTVYGFCTMDSRGRRKAGDDDAFFPWLVYEVYKGKDGLLFLSMELGITALQSQDTLKCFGTIWIKN